MHIRLAHYRNRFTMFRNYYALGAGLIKTDGLSFSISQLPDPPSRALEQAVIQGDVDIANVYFPNFLERKLEAAPIIGLCTEWKSTAKGNGIFVRKGTFDNPKELEGKRITTHQGRHAIHQYLLGESYQVNTSGISWAASPQETLLGVLHRNEADAVVLLDQFFHHGEQDEDVACLYTDGSAWQKLTGFDEMIKHMIAANETFLARNPDIVPSLLQAFRESHAYSERNIEEVADVFLRSYPGDRDALLISARYPRMTFTINDNELRLGQQMMKMFVATGRLSREEPVESMFVKLSS